MNDLLRSRIHFQSLIFALFFKEMASLIDVQEHFLDDLLRLALIVGNSQRGMEYESRIALKKNL